MKSNSKNAMAVLAGISIAVLLLEVALRSFSGNFAVAQLVEIQPGSGCPTLKANASVLYTGSLLKMDVPVLQETNEQGFRGPAAAYAKTTTTVAVLGDSFVYGMGLSYQDSIPARLDSLFRKDIRFLNFGVPGFSLRETIDRYKTFAAQWEHDFVLVFVYSNDLGPRLCDMVPSIWVQHLFGLSYLFRTTYLLLHTALYETPSLQDKTSANKFERLIVEIEQLATQNNATLIPVILAWPIDPQQADQLALPKNTLDLSIATQKAPKIPKEGHFNSEGTKQIAKKVEEHLLHLGYPQFSGALTAAE